MKIRDHATGRDINVQTGGGLLLGVGERCGMKLRAQGYVRRVNVSVIPLRSGQSVLMIDYVAPSWRDAFDEPRRIRRSRIMAASKAMRVARLASRRMRRAVI